MLLLWKHFFTQLPDLSFCSWASDVDRPVQASCTPDGWQAQARKTWRTEPATCTQKLSTLPTPTMIAACVIFLAEKQHPTGTPLYLERETKERRKHALPLFSFSRTQERRRAKKKRTKFLTLSTIHLICSTERRRERRNWDGGHRQERVLLLLLFFFLRLPTTSFWIFPRSVFSYCSRMLFPSPCVGRCRRRRVRALLHCTGAACRPPANYA